LLYDRGLLLLGRRICHCGFFLLASHKECGPGKDNNIFFHNVGTNVQVVGEVAGSVVVAGEVGAGLAAGSVVSVFCSHAARRAALARMQMYFFIVIVRGGTLL
jgi:hypothetical protein